MDNNHPSIIDEDLISFRIRIHNYSKRQIVQEYGKITSLIKNHSNKPHYLIDLYLKRGLVLKSCDDCEGAKLDFKKVLEIDSNHRMSLFQLASLYHNSSPKIIPTAMNQITEKLLSQNPRDCLGLFLKAVRKRKREEFFNLIDEVIENSEIPEVHLANMMKGNVSEHFETSERCYRNCLDLFPSIKALQKLAQLYIKNYRYKLGLEMLQKAIEINPEFEETNYFMGKYYFYNAPRGEQHKCLKYFEKEIEINPIHNHRTYRLLAKYHAGINNLEKALEYIDRSIELSNDSNISHTNKGIIFDKMNKFEEALKEFKWGIERSNETQQSTDFSAVRLFNFLFTKCELFHSERKFGLCLRMCEEYIKYYGIVTSPDFYSQKIGKKISTLRKMDFFFNDLQIDIVKKYKREIFLRDDLGEILGERYGSKGISEDEIERLEIFMDNTFLEILFFIGPSSSPSSINKKNGLELVEIVVRNSSFQIKVLKSLLGF